MSIFEKRITRQGWGNIDEPIVRQDNGEVALASSLDPDVGGSWRDKPIWDISTIEDNLNRSGYSWYVGNYGELDDGVLNFGFWSSYEQLAQSYYVNTDGTIAFNEAYYAADFSVFTAEQKAMARKAIALWDDLVDIKFKETSAEEADLAYGNTYTGGAQAYAYLPFGDSEDPFYETFGFEETGRLGGDVWIDGFVASNFNPVTDSYYATTTMIHETGHALGLSHPGDYDALDDDDGDGQPDPITYANDAAFAQDSLQYSIMSYFDAYETGAQHIDWTLLNFSFAATPLIHDIAAIQAMYGADTKTRTGNTTYGFNSNAGRSAYDFTVNTRPVVAIWDAGGTDTLDFSGWSTNSIINLNEGGFSSGGGSEEFLTLEEVNANRAALGFAPRTQETWDFYEAIKTEFGVTSGLFTDNISIAYGAIIENAVGGAGNDLIYANQVANKIKGGRGIDTVSYAEATGGVTADLSKGGSQGYAKGDKYESIEGLVGTDFADKLTGNGNDNLLDGGDGVDVLKGGSGGDTLLGGGADDKLEGGSGEDILDGGDGADRLTGGSSDDIFRFTTLGLKDVITDFSKGDDDVDLTGIDAIAGTAAIDAFTFIGTKSFSAAGQLRYYRSGDDLFLAGDVDGDRQADLLIRILDEKSISNGDLILA